MDLEIDDRLGFARNHDAPIPHRVSGVGFITRTTPGV